MAMKKINKISYFSFALMILLIILFFPLIIRLDLSFSWPFLLILLIAIFLLIMAAVNFKKFILFLIIFLPTIFYFNDLKINLAQYFPFFRDQTILINPIAIIYLLLILFALFILVQERQKLKKLPLKYIIALVIIYGAISISWSGYRNISLIEIIYLAVPFAFYLITYLYFSKKQDFLKIIFAIILSSIIPLIVATQQVITKKYFFEPGSHLGRLISTFAHPNSFALYLFIILCLVIAYYLSKGNRKIFNNKILTLYFILTFIFIILTYSRTAWACFFLFLILLIFIKRQLLIFLGILSPLALILFATIESIKYRVLELFSTGLFSSWVARKNIWQVAINKITQRPIIGHGIGTAETTIERAKNWQGGTSLPHNDFILHALETGVLGVILFIGYTLGMLYYIFKTYLFFPNKNIKIKIWGRDIEINFKMLSYGIFAMVLSLALASVFESASQKIIIQIFIWSILGSLLGLKNSMSHES